MILKQRYSLLMATLATIISISSNAQADRVFLTAPTNNTNIVPGCPVDVEFSIQYSGLAILKAVQLQVLRADNSVLIDCLEYTSRTEWGDSHTREVLWAVPADWAPGDYIVRVFGNATYPCFRDGHHTRCSHVVEDRETVHLKPLDAGIQRCPSVTKTLTDGDSQVNYSTQSSEDKQKMASNNSTTTDHPKEVINATTNSDNRSSRSGNIITKIATSNSTGTETRGTEGSSTQIHIILNQATLERIQDQIIRKVLSDAQDYNLVKATVTLLNGTVVPIPNLMDNSTTTRFIQTLETTHATLTSNNRNSSNGLHVLGTAELVEALHRNSSLIQAPKSSSSNTTLSCTLDRNNETTDPSGRQFTQQQADGDQIQDKSNEASAHISVQSYEGLCTLAALVLISGSWVL